jgi:hypothetical protein
MPEVETRRGAQVEVRRRRWVERRTRAGDDPDGAPGGDWYRRPGGTAGGIGRFLMGLAMAAAGGFLILNQARVTTGYWAWWGQNTFGLTLVPLILGIGLLFFNGRSVLGWLLSGLGLVVIIVGVIANLHLYFPATSLFNLLVMLVLFVGGLGLLASALVRR